MGFCFLNNVAIAARHALDFHGLSRVAIVDFDVHHGNGTEDVFAGDERRHGAPGPQYAERARGRLHHGRRGQGHRHRLLAAPA
ncbi:hypothetical protein G6F59_018362 [Rhizopus arrhizus]|nr:hypothetical protein G6F59_018362 [Rhizopus arrhizus]